MLSLVTKYLQGTGNREYEDIIVGYVDEYEDLLESKRIRFNEEG